MRTCGWERKHLTTTAIITSWIPPMSRPGRATAVRSWFSASASQAGFDYAARHATSSSHRALPARSSKTPSPHCRACEANQAGLFKDRTDWKSHHLPLIVCKPTRAGAYAYRDAIVARPISSRLPPTPIGTPRAMPKDGSNTYLPTAFLAATFRSSAIRTTSPMRSLNCMTRAWTEFRSVSTTYGPDLDFFAEAVLAAPSKTRFAKATLMTSDIILNATIMGVGMHLGAWRHRPESPADYLSIDYYRDGWAQLAEEAAFTRSFSRTRLRSAKKISSGRTSAPWIRLRFLAPSRR